MSRDRCAAGAHCVTASCGAAAVVCEHVPRALPFCFLVHLTHHTPHTLNTLCIVTKKRVRRSTCLHYVRCLPWSFTVRCSATPIKLSFELVKAAPSNPRLRRWHFRMAAKPHARPLACLAMWSLILFPACCFENLRAWIALLKIGTNAWRFTTRTHVAIVHAASFTPRTHIPILLPAVARDHVLSPHAPR
jgi:hypothetical protein